MANNQEKSNNTLTLFIKFVKKNLSFILIIPTFLGGIWQIIELSSISISFIRFFSVTQLVSDGLLIIVVIFPWIFGYFIFNILYQQMKKDFKKERENKKDKIYTVVIIFVVISMLWYVSNVKTNIYFGYIILVINTYFTFFGVLLVFAERFFNFFSKITKNKKITFILILSVLLSFSFHQFFFIPENLKNLKNLPNGNIQYFNDKYIFIENDDKTIEVVKFDKLFKE